jgi:type I restriction enzyme, S subunit
VSNVFTRTGKVIEQTKRVKQGLLQIFMTRGIGHSRFKKTEIGEIPEDWEVVKVEDVATRGSGHTPSKQYQEYWDGDIKWASLSDSDALDHVYLSTTRKTITPEGIANSSAVVHPAGTVFVSRDASVGRSAIAACDLAVSQHFIAWQCGDRLNNHFLYYFLQHHKPQFERIAVGSTIKTIGLGYFKDLRIPLPPTAEQGRIVEVLLGHDRAVWAQESTSEELEVLKRGLTRDLLTGRVRVQPD